jgi:hypothetical protein
MVYQSEDADFRQASPPRMRGRRPRDNDLVEPSGVHYLSIDKASGV